DLPHECVAWKWERLSRWISKEAAAAKSLRLLRDLAEKRQPLTGSVLEEAKGFREGGRLDGGWPRRYLSDTEVRQVRDWIETSEQREHSQRLRLLRERRRALITAIGATVVGLVLTALGIWALHLKSRADEEARQAQIALARSAVQDGMRLFENKYPSESGQ